MLPVVCALFTAGRLSAANNPTYCPALAAPTGNVISVSNTTQLSSALASASAGSTILLADGTYTQTGTLYVHTSNVTLRSASGNRDAVILDGNYAIGEGIYIDAANVTIADLTLKRAQWHPLHIVGAPGTMIYNVRIIDGGQQFVKINAPTNSGPFSDNGTIACSSMELTSTGRAYVEAHPASSFLNCYTGGVDALQVRGWTVRDSTVEGMYCTNGGLSQHGIHFWASSRDSIVERNVLLNNARGIGFGLGPSAGGGSTAGPRTYSDLAGTANISSVDHIGGVIRNNFVATTITEADTGISLESAWNAAVYHNTVYATTGLVIDYRFFMTNVQSKNNLLSGGFSLRDSATPVQQGNVTNASSNLFVNAPSGDLHLVTGAAAAINKGVTLSGLVPADIDNQSRDGQPDVGADEFSAGTPPVTACDINHDSSTNVNDVQLCANQAIGTTACSTGDITGDGNCNVVDVQRVVNAALGGQCVAP